MTGQRQPWYRMFYTPAYLALVAHEHRRFFFFFPGGKDKVSKLSLGVMEAPAWHVGPWRTGRKLTARQLTVAAGRDFRDRDFPLIWSISGYFSWFLPLQGV